MLSALLHVIPAAMDALIPDNIAQDGYCSPDIYLGAKKCKVCIIIIIIKKHNHGAVSLVDIYARSPGPCSLS